MKKIICLLLTLMLVLSGCGQETVTKDITAIKDTIISQLEITEALDLPAERLLDLYGIEASQIKISACFITMGGAFPDEIVMVEAVDAAAAKTVAEKLEARLADVKNQAQNYDAESYALLEKCKVSTNGLYVTLFISAKSADMQSIFDKA